VPVFDEARIREVFDVYEKVTSVTLPMRHGFGSVTFANRTDANAAILNLDGHELTVPRSYGGNESYGTISVSESKFQSAVMDCLLMPRTNPYLQSSTSAECFLTMWPMAFVRQMQFTPNKPRSGGLVSSVLIPPLNYGLLG
jgi:RNA recognition motif-containing protein